MYCYHTELADISLRYYRRGSRTNAWTLEKELTAATAAAFEYGSTTRLDAAPLLLD